MTTWNTITVQTSDHGPVSVQCPDWCTGDGHPDGGYRSDISHYGPEVVVTVRTVHGPRGLLDLGLTQYAFSERGPGTDVFVSAHLLDGDHYPYDVEGLDRLAADLVRAAGRVRSMARLLAVETQGGDR